MVILSRCVARCPRLANPKSISPSQGTYDNISEATKRGAELTAVTGCKRATPALELACLRALPFENLTGAHIPYPQPIVDGHVLRHYPSSKLSATSGVAATVPLIGGSVVPDAFPICAAKGELPLGGQCGPAPLNSSAATACARVGLLERGVPPSLMERALAAYDFGGCSADGPRRCCDVVSDALRHFALVCNMRRFLRAAAAAGNDRLFGYSIECSAACGYPHVPNRSTCAHSFELAFLFHTLSGLPGYIPQPHAPCAWTSHSGGFSSVSRHDIAGIWVAFFQECRQYRCAQELVRRWVGFAADGVPAGGWPEFRANSSRMLGLREYGSDSIEAFPEICDEWDAVDLEIAAEKGFKSDDEAEPCVSVVADLRSKMSHLAARELRRYIWHATGRLPTVSAALSEAPPSCRRIVVAESAAWLRRTTMADAIGSSIAARVGDLNDAEHLILSPAGSPNTALVAGGSGIGVLYAAYRFAEHLGVHFSVAGDVLPHRPPGFFDEPEAGWGRVDVTSKPRFALRGLQPFYNFAQG